MSFCPNAELFPLCRKLRWSLMSLTLETAPAHSQTLHSKGTRFALKNHCQAFTTRTHDSRARLSAAETPTCLPVGIWLPQTQPSPAGLVLTFPALSKTPLKQGNSSPGDANAISIFIVNDRVAKPKITAGIWSRGFYWTNDINKMVPDWASEIHSLYQAIENRSRRAINTAHNREELND